MAPLPYLVMGTVALIMLAAVRYLRPAPVRVWIFVVTGGSISIGDLFVTGIFNLYEYKPGLLSGRADNYLGVLIAECLFVPSYYALLSAVPQRFRVWVMSLSFAPLLATEILFRHLRIYAHHGWQYTYTVVLFLAFSLLAARGIRAFEQRGYSKWQRALLVGGSVYFAMNLWGLIPFGILRISTLHMRLVRDAELDLVFSSLLLHAIPFTLMGLTGIWIGWIRRLPAAGVAAVLFTAWLLFLQFCGIWEGRWPWNPALDAVLAVTTHYLLALLDRWMARFAPPPRIVPPWRPPVSSRP